MTIGDRLYFDADFTHPIKNHPEAPFTDAIGNVLRQAYLHAQHGNRLLINQSYGFDLAGAETDRGSARRSFAGNLDIGVARGFANIPREATHLRASIMFSVRAFSVAEVDHTLRISGTPDTNTEVFFTPSSQDPQRANSIDQARLQVEFPFSERYKTYRTEVLTPITSALPGVKEIRVSAHAENDASSQAEQYQPLYCAVWWEYLPT